ncbi:MAG TPA: DUF6585 family protein [Polyangiaceae bacterium]|nr:DUF6585 family protein [Polyangiaceae bacterium]
MQRPPNPPPGGPWPPPGPHPPQGSAGPFYHQTPGGPFAPQGPGAAFPPPGPAGAYPQPGPGGAFPQQGPGGAFPQGPGGAFPPQGPGGAFPPQGGALPPGGTFPSGGASPPGGHAFPPQGPGGPPPQAWAGTPPPGAGPYGGPAPADVSPWASMGALGACLSEHPIKGVSRWGSLIFGILLLAGAASAVGFGLLSVALSLSSRYGPDFGGLVTSLVIGLPLALLGGFLLFNAWRSWPLAAALFEKGVGYRDRKGARPVAFADVTSVWQAITRRYVNGVYAGTTHVYRAQTRAGETLVFDDRLRDVEKLGEALVKASAAALLPGALRAFEAGERVPFGPLALDRAGLHSGGKSLPWAEVKAVKIERGLISVDRDGKWFAWTRATVPQIPNFYVLVALLDRLGKLG